MLPVMWAVARVAALCVLAAATSTALFDAADNVPPASTPRPGLANDPAAAAAEACTVFCDGPLLRAAQLGGLFNDSKTFVDMPLLVDPAAALAQFAAAFPDPHNASGPAMAAFVAAHFGAVGSDVANCTPGDFRPRPPLIVDRVTTNASLDFALAVNAIWPQLCREAVPDVALHPARHTLLAAPHPMIVPGGRFRESYYWDSYWIVRGLLVSGMQHTACGVVQNLLAAAEAFGFVPNGLRAYYLTRSQPPLLSQMVHALLDSFDDAAADPAGDAAEDYHDSDGNNTGSRRNRLATAPRDPNPYCGFSSRQGFLERWLPALDREYGFWMANRSVAVVAANRTAFVLNLYNASADIPRPESYAEDATNSAAAAAAAAAVGQDPEAAAHAFDRGVATAAESGWDFTARWFRDGHNITSIGDALPRIVPVELNAYLLRMEQNLAAFHGQLAGHTNRGTPPASAAASAAAAAVSVQEEAAAVRYAAAAAQRAAAMDALMWNATTRQWNDLYFDWAPVPGAVAAGTTTPPAAAATAAGTAGTAAATAATVAAQQLLRPFASSSSFLPLWAGANVTLVDGRLAQAAQALLDSPLWLTGGVVSTTANGTGQQWDWPNAWSPLQHMLIEGLVAVRGGHTTTTTSSSSSSSLYTAGNSVADGPFAAAARDLAQRWLRSNYQAFLTFGGHMYEKYDAARPGLPGGGGEYASAQLGFGWTNGVVLALLDLFGDIDVAGNSSSSSDSTSRSSGAAALL